MVMNKTVYIHENNLLTKISSDYQGLKNEISVFKKLKYDVFKSKIKESVINENFSEVTDLINDYIDELTSFQSEHKIKSQSKFSSSFYEEISTLLFENIEEIRDNTLGIYNKSVYSGLKVDSNLKLSQLTKDVDFCIGKKVRISIDETNYMDIIVPIIVVEVKTYLDGTMFNEAQFTAEKIKNASPDTKTLMFIGYRSIANDRLQEGLINRSIDQIFQLSEDKNNPFLSDVIEDYYNFIKTTIKNLKDVPQLPTSGALY